LPKPQFQSEWKFWAAIGAVSILLMAYLYFASRPPMEGGEHLYQAIGVIDEKTLKLKGAGQTMEFRLAGIEIPANQAPAARDLLKQTIEGKWLRPKVLREDASGVKEGFLFLSGEDVHARLVRQGRAVIDRNAQGFDVRVYIELELEAKKEKRGLWGASG
jgi:endonuclease YncB( thermonuclease family)